MDVEQRNRLEYMLQFVHLEKFLAILPVVNDATCSALFGIDEKTYREIKEQFALHTRQAAEELLADPAFVADVDRVPFERGQKILGFGSSTTDESHSWFEILRQVFTLRRPQDELQFVNAGLSNDTTTHLLARFMDMVKEQPAWIICHIGANDARLHGLSPTKTLVSLEESEKNLVLLRHFAASQTQARWLWMTPAAVIEERLAANPLLSLNQATVRNEDLAALARVVLSQPDPVVNLWPLFGQPADPDLVLWDGMHPTLKGHMYIVRALIAHLGRGE